MVRWSPDDCEKRIEGANPAPCKYCKAYADCRMSVEFVQAAWLRYAMYQENFFRYLTLEINEATRNQASHPANRQWMRRRVRSI